MELRIENGQLRILRYGRWYPVTFSNCMEVKDGDRLEALLPYGSGKLVLTVSAKNADITKGD